MLPGSKAPYEPVDLYRSEHVTVRSIAFASSGRCVVTFDNYGIGHGFDRPGFSQEWLASQGISAIHVMGRAEDWYQYPDIIEALATVRSAVAGASRVMTYGSSMGGYAAVRFADDVGAHMALAFSPQYTLDPLVAAHDARWAQDARRICWNPQLNRTIKSAVRPIVIYDSAGPDRWHAERIVADTDGTPIALPHTGHPVTSFLAEVHLLGPLALAALDGSLDAGEFRRKARRARAGSGVFLGELAERVAVRSPDKAMALARRAVAVSEGNDLARLSLARRLMTAGDKEEAVVIFRSLVGSSNRQDVYLVALAQALAETGQRDEARLLAGEVASKAGRMAHLYAWAASIFWLGGDVAEARRLIEQAVEYDPTHRAYIGMRTDYWLGARGRENGSVRQTPLLQLARGLARFSPSLDLSRIYARRARKSERTRTS